MEQTIERISHFLSDPHKVQLATVAATASLLTLGSVFTYQQISRRNRVAALKKSFGQDERSVKNDIFRNQKESCEVVEKNSIISLSTNEEALFAEQLTRNMSFFGSDNLEKIKESFVIVVGAGGVGSWAALMLLRSGIQRMRIIDFDQVTLSSLNRHAVAARKDVGISKVDSIKSFFLDITPHAKIDARVELFSKENAEELLAGSPDYVLDCIDNIDTKLDLLKYCYDNSIKVISSMGAGMKADPSRVQIADIGNTFEDQLSRSVRRKLKKMGVENGIEVVYSTEKPGKLQLVSLFESQEEKIDEFSILPDFRVRIVPVLGTIPAIFGMVMATHVLTQLGNFPTTPLAIKGRNALYNRLHRDLIIREQKLTGSKVAKAPPLTIDDCGYVLEEIWRGKSAISGATDKLALTRWNLDLPISLQNCVCMTKAEADKHMKLEMPPELHYSKDVTQLVTLRFEEEKVLSKSR